MILAINVRIAACAVLFVLAAPALAEASNAVALTGAPQKTAPKAGTTAAAHAKSTRSSAVPALVADPGQTWFGIGVGAYRGERTAGGAAKIDLTHTSGKFLVQARFSGYLDSSYTNCFLFCGSINETALMVGMPLYRDVWAATGINRTATHGFGDPVPGFVTAGIPLEIIFAPRTRHPVGFEASLHGDINHKTSLVALTIGVRFGVMK